MRVKGVKILLLSLLAFLVSCKVEMPKSVPSPAKMEAILYDYHLAQSMATTNANVDYKEKLLYKYVFDKHGISKAEFDSALVWYNRNPKYMKEIYSGLESRVQREIDYLGGAKIAMDDGVAIEAAYLASNIAELWTSQNVRLLSTSPLNNKLAFTFDTPKDSSFIAGDSLVFSFNAFFLSENAQPVKQEAYASVILEYNDKSVRVNGVGVDEPGHYDIAVPRNYGSRLKSMSGYVYYFDNDTSDVSRMVLSDLSVKRIHPVQAKKEKQGK